MTEFNPIQINTMPIKEKILNSIWLCINKSLFRFSPPHFTIFRKYRILLIKIFGGKVQWDCSIHPHSIIEYPWNLTLGHKSSLGEKSWIYALNKINIGTNCCIGKDVYLITGSHSIEKSTFDLITKPIIIMDNVWISTGAYILQGVTIERNAVVGARSVVSKNVEEYFIVAGNPAKFIKKREIII